MTMPKSWFGWTAVLAVWIVAGTCAITTVSAVDYTLTLTGPASWSAAGWTPSDYPGQVLPPGPYDTATIVFNGNNTNCDLALDAGTPIYLQKLSFTTATTDRKWGFTGGNGQVLYVNTIEWNTCTGNQDGNGFNWTINNLNSDGTAGVGDLLTIRNMNTGYRVMAFGGAQVNARNGLRLDGLTQQSYIRFTNLNIAAGGLEIGQARVEMTNAKTINGDLKFSVVGLNTTQSVYSNGSATSVTGNLVLARGISAANNIRFEGAGTVTVSGDLMVANGAAGAWLDVSAPINVARLNEAADASAGSALNLLGTGTLTIANSALRTGATNISAGTVTLSAANGLSSNNSAIAVTGTGSLNANAIDALGTAAVTLNGGGANLNLGVSGLIGPGAASLTWTAGRVRTGRRWRLGPSVQPDGQPGP